MSSSKAENGVDQRLELSCAHARAIDQSSFRRRSVPVRSAFARDMSGAGNAPMAKLVGIGGRGGEVLLKLYLALIWRSSAAPFTTDTSARKWAELLALAEPSKSGARRITDGLQTLAEHRLIAVEHRRGEPSLVTLLNESGNGEAYSLPRGGKDDHYFQIPAEMWLTGQLQQLSTPALAMLMAVLAEQTEPGAQVWWSTQRFPGRFRLSSATRARGTRELVDAGLLNVTRKSVAPTPGRSFASDRVRNVYTVDGMAKLTLPPNRFIERRQRSRRRSPGAPEQDGSLAIREYGRRG